MGFGDFIKNIIKKNKEYKEGIAERQELEIAKIRSQTEITKAKADLEVEKAKLRKAKDVSRPQIKFGFDRLK